MHVTAALWKCWDPSYWWTYQRRCVNAGAKGFDARAGTSAGQPTRELVGRETVVVSGPIIHGRLDVDYLDHGPPRGRAAALSRIANSTCPTASLLLSLATWSTTGRLPTCQKDVQQCGGVWSVCTVMKTWSSCCQRCPRCGSVLARLPGDPVLSRQYRS